MIKEDVRMKKWAPRVLLAAALAGLSAFLLKGDVWTFWTWWLLAFLMGMVAMPVTGRLFAGFEDKGWMFSKVLAITVTGFLTQQQIRQHVSILDSSTDALSDSLPKQVLYSLQSPGQVSLALHRNRQQTENLVYLMHNQAHFSQHYNVCRYSVPE